MFTEKFRPSFLSRAELDFYLDRAWYRMGQSIFTCHFLYFGEQIFSALWLRLRLDGYTFRKSLRRVWKRNKHFRVVIRPVRLDEEKESLYQKYRWYCFRGNISTSLQESLLDGGEHSVFTTLEACVFDGGKLIAASFFDIGENSIASILGMYDPDYEKYGLGFYTMLLEIQYGLDHDFEFYYPGYVVPGYSRFDYKKRIGEVDYFDLEASKWLPYRQIQSDRSPIASLRQKLSALQRQLEFYNISSQLYYYPLFETHLITYWKANYLKYPIFLWCPTSDGSADYLLVVYDLPRQRYMLLQCSLFSDLPSFLEEILEDREVDYPNFLEVLLVRHLIVANSSAEQMAQSLLRLRQVRRFK